MAVSKPRTRTALNDQIAEELRALLARRRISGREFARRIDKPPAWVNFRLTGHTQISFDDAQLFAETLGITIVDLLPPSARSVTAQERFAPAVTGPPRRADNHRRPGARPNGHPRQPIPPRDPARPRRIPRGRPAYAA